jgi:hypothetical protein
MMVGRVWPYRASREQDHPSGKGERNVGIDSDALHIDLRRHHGGRRLATTAGLI